MFYLTLTRLTPETTVQRIIYYSLLSNTGYKNTSLSPPTTFSLLLLPPPSGFSPPPFVAFLFTSPASAFAHIPVSVCGHVVLLSWRAWSYCFGSHFKPKEESGSENKTSHGKKEWKSCNKMLAFL